MTSQLSIPFPRKRRLKFKPLNIDFSKRRENNRISQALLERYCHRIKSQNQKVLIYLTFGHELTFDYMYQRLRIKHLPRRIKDIEEFCGLYADRRYDETGSAHYWLSEENRIKAMGILKGIS